MWYLENIVFILAGVFALLSLFMLRSSIKKDNEIIRLIGVSGDAGRHALKMRSQAELYFAEKVHFKKMLEMYEGKETAHFKMMDRLVDDHADLVSMRSLWAVMEAIDMASLDTPDKELSNVEVVALAVKKDMKAILFERNGHQRVVSEVDDDQEYENIIVFDEDMASGEEDPKP
ncbi:MAG: hypothetical protein ACTSVR_03205 [Candidatus Thorarchaeota archaeon]